MSTFVFMCTALEISVEGAQHVRADTKGTSRYSSSHPLLLFVASCTVRIIGDQTFIKYLGKADFKKSLSHFAIGMLNGENAPKSSSG